MTNISPSTPLFEVLQNREAKRVLQERVPGITGSPILHTLHRYPIGTLLATEPALVSAVEQREEILGSLAAIGPAARAASRSRTELPSFTPHAQRHGVASITRSGRVWQRAEISLEGPPTAQLRARFTAPDGRIIEAPGFWDGASTHRVRLLADVPGRWTFITISDAAELNGATGLLDIGGAADGQHGPVRVHERFHFAHADGTAFLPIGTTAYAWTHQGDDIEEQTLRTLADAPFTKIRMGVFPKSYTFNRNEPDIYPFSGNPERGFDLNAPNPVFWARFEQRIDELAALGLECDLILFHPYDRWGFATMTPQQDDAYVAYAVARLASFPNVWWSLANEYDLLFEKTEEDWEAFAAIVQRDDPYGHLLSIHNWHELYDYGRPWVTHVSVQWQDLRATEYATEWRERWGKPVIIDECAYEGDIDQRWGNISGEEMTRRFWEAAVRGAYASHGETYQRDDELLWWAKGGALQGSSPERLAFLRGILEEAPAALEPAIDDWGAPTAGVVGEYLLFYFGVHRPSFRRLVLDPATAYTVDVIDTWGCTVERLPGTYRGRFEVALPGREYMALRLIAAEASA